MLTQIYRILVSNSSLAKRIIWKNWYQLISRNNREPELIFMNYGFMNDSKITLQNEDETNRLFIQLYNKVLSPISVEGKKILEVGSGRGGGAFFVARYLKPKQLIGIDISPNAIQLCNKIFNSTNLSFKVGDSENIPFPENEFEVVYNVESSHCYGSRKKFTNEVYRVLKSTGYFCWADICTLEEWDEVVKITNESGFKIIHSENITENVIKALDDISLKKEEVINNRVPKFIRKTFKDFAGVKGTRVYNSFKSGALQYFHIVAQK